MAQNLPFTLLNSEAVLNIINNRKDYGIIDRSQVGEWMKFTVQGDGNILAANRKDGTTVISRTDGGQLFKKIWNVKAISRIAMLNPVIKKFLVDGLAAEQAGDKVKAHENFNQYLNKVQISFSVLLPNALADQITKNVQIAGTVDLISNPDVDASGKETGLFREILTIKDVSVVVAKSAAKKVATFMLSDLLGVPTGAEADNLFQPAAEVGGGAEPTLADSLTPAVPATEPAK